MKVMLHKTEGT